MAAREHIEKEMPVLEERMDAGYAQIEQEILAMADNKIDHMKANIFNTMRNRNR